MLSLLVGQFKFFFFGGWILTWVIKVIWENSIFWNSSFEKTSSMWIQTTVPCEFVDMATTYLQIFKMDISSKPDQYDAHETCLFKRRDSYGIHFFKKCIFWNNFRTMLFDQTMCYLAKIAGYTHRGNIFHFKNSLWYK